MLGIMCFVRCVCVQCGVDYPHDWGLKGGLTVCASHARYYTVIPLCLFWHGRTNTVIVELDTQLFSLFGPNEIVKLFYWCCDLLHAYSFDFLC